MTPIEHRDHVTATNESSLQQQQHHQHNHHLSNGHSDSDQELGQPLLSTTITHDDLDDDDDHMDTKYSHTNSHTPSRYLPRGPASWWVLLLLLALISPVLLSPLMYLIEELQLTHLIHQCYLHNQCVLTPTPTPTPLPHQQLASSPMRTSALAPPASSGPRVLVLSSDSRPVPDRWPREDDDRQIEYPVWASINQRLYSQKHGYDYYMWKGESRGNETDLNDQLNGNGSNYRFPERKPRTSSWSKLYAVRRILPLYDYIISVDSDAVFMNVSESLTDFLGRHAPSMLHTNDIILAHSLEPLLNTSDGCYINAGVFLLKNTGDKAQELIDYWWTSIDLPYNSWNKSDLPANPVIATYCQNFTHDIVWPDLYKDYWPAEQKILSARLLCDPYWTNFIFILPPNLMFGPEGEFIAHVTQYWPEIRQDRIRRAAIDAALQVTVTALDSIPERMKKVYMDEVEAIPAATAGTT